MNKSKRLQDLVIKDNFMFGAVMIDEENCRLLLERVLDIPIGRVKVCKEKSIIYNPEYKGVRLDVYGQGDSFYFNVEMQVRSGGNLMKRARYYQSQMDMELLLSGIDYEQLPKLIVIFICDYDPFSEGRYRYTFKTACLESSAIDFRDERQYIFLNTKGKNDTEVSEKLVKLMAYMSAELEDSNRNFEDDYVKRLQTFVQYVKTSREFGGRYMTFQELLKEERKEGREEGKILQMQKNILQALSAKGQPDAKLQEMILSQTSMDVLEQWFASALRQESLERFQERFGLK